MAASTDNQENTCIICNKEVEGELRAYEGYLLYVDNAGSGFGHRHNLSNWSDARKKQARRKDTRMEDALTKLVLNPDNKQARAKVDELIWEQLMSVVKEGSATDSLRASERILTMFVGDEPQPTATPGQPPEPEIIVTMLESPSDGRPSASELMAGEQTLHGDDDAEEPEETRIPDDTYDDEMERAKFWNLQLAALERRKRPVKPYAIRSWSG